MNKRPFLFGLGVGIIVGAALLQLMLIGEKQASSLDDYDKGNQTSVTYTQAELDKRIAEERAPIQAEDSKEAKSSAENLPKQDSVNPQNGKQPSNSKPAVEKSAGSLDTKGTNTTNKVKRIVLRIPANSSVTETADLLIENDVISNKQTFINLMRKVIIRAGYFSFEGRPTLQEVKTIITSKPLPPEQAEAELQKNKDT
ncbi:hypothetical protein ACFPYJ_07595 [Paenibacillus solisilvae]|uniref:Endolytic transglycosylase MltG n=1 Tax=Paenibacillus solisilvae TaxID=2486751 RepID=A0ABW0VTU0_9BACL